MPGDTSYSSTTDEISDLRKRVNVLELMVRQVIETRVMPTPFSFSGPLQDDVESPPWRPVHPVTIALIVPHVLTPPSGGDLTINLALVSGPTTGVVRTLTIPDGDNYVEDADPFQIGMGGALTATVTNAAGAADLSISLVPQFG